MRQILRDWFGDSTRRSCASSRARLGVEALEERWCPAFVTQVGPDGSELLIRGKDSVGEVVLIEHNDSNLHSYGGLPLDTIRITKMTSSGPATWSFSSSSIKTLTIDLGGGDDVIEWHLRSPFANSPFIEGARKSISIDLGDGADRAELHFEGAHLNATVYNVLDINIKAGRHEDEVNAYFGSIAGALYFNADMGTHDDVARVGFMNHTYGNVNVDVRGNNGNDDLWVGGGANPDTLLPFDITDGTSATWILDGGKGKDTLRSNYRGVLDGYLTLRMDGKAGDDILEAKIYAMSGSTGSLDAYLYGGSERDHLDMRIYELAGSSIYITQAEINGGTGSDRRHRFVTDNVVVQSCEGLYPVLSATTTMPLDIVPWS